MKPVCCRCARRDANFRGSLHPFLHRGGSVCETLRSHPRIGRVLLLLETLIKCRARAASMAKRDRDVRRGLGGVGFAKGLFCTQTLFVLLKPFRNMVKRLVLSSTLTQGVLHCMVRHPFNEILFVSFGLLCLQLHFLSRRRVPEGRHSGESKIKLYVYPMHTYQAPSLCL